jgi:hypothetical protein
MRPIRPVGCAIGTIAIVPTAPDPDGVDQLSTISLTTKLRVR